MSFNWCICFIYLVYYYVNCELNRSDTPLEPLNNLYANSIHTALDVGDLAAVKDSFTSDGIFIYIKHADKNI